MSAFVFSSGTWTRNFQRTKSLKALSSLWMCRADKFHWCSCSTYFSLISLIALTYQISITLIQRFIIVGLQKETNFWIVCNFKGLKELIVLTLCLITKWINNARTWVERDRQNQWRKENNDELFDITSSFNLLY
jgi:hypothetical protein